MCRTGRLQVVLVVEPLRVPPPKGAKGNEETTSKDRTPKRTRSQSDPSQQGDPGVVSVDPLQTGVSEQTSPLLTLRRSDADARSCWTVANAKPQSRVGLGWQRVRTPGALTDQAAY